jgi:hypothetical protein
MVFIKTTINFFVVIFSETFHKKCFESVWPAYYKSVPSGRRPHVSSPRNHCAVFVNALAERILPRKPVLFRGRGASCTNSPMHPCPWPHETGSKLYRPWIFCYRRPNCFSTVLVSVATGTIVIASVPDESSHPRIYCFAWFL